MNSIIIMVYLYICCKTFEKTCKVCFRIILPGSVAWILMELYFNHISMSLFPVHLFVIVCIRSLYSMTWFFALATFVHRIKTYHGISHFYSLILCHCHVRANRLSRNNKSHYVCLLYFDICVFETLPIS